VACGRPEPTPAEPKEFQLQPPKPFQKNDRKIVVRRHRRANVYNNPKTLSKILQKVKYLDH
jgi:hypothetical protein